MIKTSHNIKSIANSGAKGRLGILLTETLGQYWALSMALISAIAAVIAFYGPRLQVTKLAALRRPGVGGSFTYGVIFSLGTSAAPLLLFLTLKQRAELTLPFVH